MTRASTIFAILCLLLLCDLSLNVDPIRAQCVTAHEFDANRIIWKSLTFKAKSFFGTVKNDIQLKILPTTESEQLLISSPTGQVLNAAGSDLFFISVISVIEPIVGEPEYINSQAWYDPNPVTVLQRIRLRQGKEKWRKTYRFTNNGVFRLRKKPNGTDEAKMPLGRWTNSEGSFYPYGVSNDGCLRVLEPSVLLYLVSAIDFTLGKKLLSLCVFNKKQLHQVQIRKAGIKRLVVDYLEKLKESEVRREGEIEAVKFSFKTRSLAGKEKKPEPFSFLGLKGDFDIYLDKTAKIPVQVSGNISGLGKVKIRLHRIELKK